MVIHVAFQGLVLICDIQKGSDVLIHAGASGVSVAATQLARLYGASVFLYPILSSLSPPFWPESRSTRLPSVTEDQSILIPQVQSVYNSLFRREDPVREIIA
jgi:hypothetical protein